jgi:hypothetical protein
MKARIVILPTGQVSIFVDEGTLETGAKAIQQLFDELEAQGVTFDSVSAVEQHRHEEQKAEAHSHVHN